MRSSIIIASFIALAAALPAVVPVDNTALTARNSSRDTTAALEPRQTVVLDRTYAWPNTSVSDYTIWAQFTATNLGNGNYEFEFSATSPEDLGVINFRVSYGGVTLMLVDLTTGHNDTVSVPKTGDNFNVFIQPRPV
ncbi:hypothetical protein NX059_009861 [Plenodomus lindquistii]|nr:hypothetical protein NX059_009861 [Plenodomus lindquistii]